MKIALSKAQWELIGKEAGWKTDEEIREEFEGMKVNNVEVRNRPEGVEWISGWIEIYSPCAGESVAGGQEGECEFVDQWMFYNFEQWKNEDVAAKISFNNWFPPDVVLKLKREILKEVTPKLF